MANRRRKTVLCVLVALEERAMIGQKMALLHTRNFSAYVRKMLIGSYVVNMGASDVRTQTAGIQKIGVDVDQITKRLDGMGSVCTQDIENMKEALAQIWQLRRYILSSQR